MNANTDFWSEIDTKVVEHDYFGEVWYLIAGVIELNGISTMFKDFVFAASFEKAEVKIKEEAQGNFIQIWSIAPEQIFSTEEIQLFRNHKDRGILPKDAKLKFRLKKNEAERILLS